MILRKDSEILMIVIPGDWTKQKRIRVYSLKMNFKLIVSLLFSGGYLNFESSVKMKRKHSLI